MFNRKPKEPSRLDKAIDGAFDDLTNHNAPSDPYARTVDQLTKLYKLKETDSKKQVSADTLALISGNLLGIVLIVGHERAHVITSKGMQFVKGLSR